MNAEKIEAIATRSARNLKRLIVEMQDDIAAAASAAAEQAEIDEKESVKITLSHSIVLDLSKNTQEDKLGVSVKRTSSLVGFMPDPNQPELPLDGEEDE